MNELEATEMGFLAILAKDIYLQFVENNKNITDAEMKELAILAHKYAENFLNIHGEWLESQYSQMKQSRSSIVTPQYFQDYSSDILMGGDFNA